MRTLKSEQLSEIRDIAEQCFSELKQPGSAFNFEHFCWAIGPALDSEQMMLWVSGSHEIRAFLLVNFAPDLFAGELTGYSISWFVKPEFRGSGIGSALVDEFLKDGHLRGCKRFLFGHPFEVNHDANQSWFEKRGFCWVEKLYRKDV